MVNLMKQLESLQEDYYTQDDQEDEENKDWDILVATKKGTEKITNLNIQLLTQMKLSKELFDKSLFYFQTTITSLETNVKFKNSIMCASVFLALSFYEEFVNEQELMKYFNITPKKFSNGLMLIKTHVLEVRIFTSSFNNLLYFICRELNMSSDINLITRFIEDYLHKFNNQKVSEKILKCLLVYIWIFLNKKKIPSLDTFCFLCGIKKRVFKPLLFRNYAMLDAFLSKKTTGLRDNFINQLNNKYSIKINYKQTLSNNGFKYFIDV